MAYYRKLEERFNETRDMFNEILITYKGETDKKIILSLYDVFEGEKFLALDHNNVTDEVLLRKLSKRYIRYWGEEMLANDIDKYVEDVRNFLTNHYTNFNKTKSARK